MNKKILTDVIIFLILICFMLPLIWMVFTSLKTGTDLYNLDSPFLLKSITLVNYKKLIFSTGFINWFINSVIISSLSTFLSIIIALPAAYAIARFPSIHIKVFSLSLVFGYALPSAVLVIPIFIIVNKIGLYDNFLVLIIVYPIFLMPFAAWLLAGYIKGIPKEVEDASRLDGCSYFKSLIYITIPMIRGGIFITAIFCFLLSWGEYVYALSLIADSKLRTLPVGIASLESGDVYIWGMIMAASVLAIIPVTVFLILVRRHLVKGLTAGAMVG